MGTAAEWHALLIRWNRLLLADEEITHGLPLETIRAGWLGYEPATDESIRRAEQRLGTTLPPTYREFVRASNGWQWAGRFIARVRPVEEVEWFVSHNRDWAEMEIEVSNELEPVADDEYFVYGDAQLRTSIRPEYMLTALQVSDVTESTVLLLNPAIQTPAGEWEAWFFAAWAAGADRYPSFWDMMESELEMYEALRTAERRGT